MQDLRRNTRTRNQGMLDDVMCVRHARRREYPQRVFLCKNSARYLRTPNRATVFVRRRGWRELAAWLAGSLCAHERLCKRNLVAHADTNLDGTRAFLKPLPAIVIRIRDWLKMIEDSLTANNGVSKPPDPKCTSSTRLRSQTIHKSVLLIPAGFWICLPSNK